MAFFSKVSLGDDHYPRRHPDDLYRKSCPTTITTWPASSPFLLARIEDSANCSSNSVSLESDLAMGRLLTTQATISPNIQPHEVRRCPRARQSDLSPIWG
jgi:hypothetical protein